MLNHLLRNIVREFSIDNDLSDIKTYEEQRRPCFKSY